MDAPGAAFSDVATEYNTLLRGSTSTAGRVAFLRFCRVNRISYTAHILEVGQATIATHASHWSLGDEFWSILEQLCVAALTNGDVAAAVGYFTQLSAKFPGSSRVQRLSGLILEAKGEWDAAVALYDGLLEANAANSLAWKRKVRRS